LVALIVGVGLAIRRSGKEASARRAAAREAASVIPVEEGIVTADYPLVLRSSPFQRELMMRTFRRPAIPDVAPDTTLFPNVVLVELPFPNDLTAINRILFSFLNDQRRPAHAYYLLDLSGSMKGQRLSQLNPLCTPSPEGGLRSTRRSRRHTGRHWRRARRTRRATIPSCC
jgi:hypothetical protein